MCWSECDECHINITDFIPPNTSIISTGMVTFYNTAWFAIIMPDTAVARGTDLHFMYTGQYHRIHIVM